MDKQGFQTMLAGRKVPAEKMDSALQLAERFEQYAAQNGGFSTETAWAFSKILIAEGQNSTENFITLARYGLFIKNNLVFVAFLEVLDGGEAQENLYQQVGARHGEAFRDEIFAGIGLAPYGLPTPEKPRFMQPVVERLEKALGSEACRALLVDSLRDLPDYAWEREIYQSCANVDEYIARKKQKFMEQMETCQREGRLFFAQEVTDEVLAYIRSQPEMGGGVRVGDITVFDFDDSCYFWFMYDIACAWYRCRSCCTSPITWMIRTRKSRPGCATKSTVSRTTFPIWAFSKPFSRRKGHSNCRIIYLEWRDNCLQSGGLPGFFSVLPFIGYALNIAAFGLLQEMGCRSVRRLGLS